VSGVVEAVGVVVVAEAVGVVEVAGVVVVAAAAAAAAVVAAVVEVAAAAVVAAAAAGQSFLCGRSRNRTTSCWASKERPVHPTSRHPIRTCRCGKRMDHCVLCRFHTSLLSSRRCVAQAPTYHSCNAGSVMRYRGCHLP